jgi:uncharacterized protein (DUF1330 family)
MPKAYVICDIEVTDPVAYEEYKKLAGPSVAMQGGRYIVRGGATEVLEGTRQPNRVVVVEFPSAADAKGWYESDAYAEARRAREGAANASLTLVEGAD